jgi:hypothetical protein
MKRVSRRFVALTATIAFVVSWNVTPISSAQTVPGRDVQNTIIASPDPVDQVIDPKVFLGDGGNDVSGTTDFKGLTFGNALTECPQAGLRDTTPRPLDLRAKDAVERKSEGGGDIRANQDYSCFPQDETSLDVNPKHPENIVGGANDYRLGWGTSGFYATTDGGKHFSFVWDGHGNNGTLWPNGSYTMTATATDASGQTTAISTQIQAKVDSVDLTQTPPLLSINGQNYTVNQLQKIVAP